MSTRQAFLVAALLTMGAFAAGLLPGAQALPAIPDPSSPFIVYPHHVQAQPGTTFSGRIYIRNDGSTPIDAYLSTDATRLWMQWVDHVVVEPHDVRTLYVTMTVNTSAPIAVQKVDFELRDRVRETLLQRAHIVLNVVPEATSKTDIDGTVAFTDIGAAGASVSEGGTIDSMITVLNPGPRAVSWPVNVTGPPGWGLRVEPSVLALSSPNGTGTIHLTGRATPGAQNGTGHITINGDTATFSYVALTLEVMERNATTPQVPHAKLNVRFSGAESFQNVAGSFRMRAWAQITNPIDAAGTVRLSASSPWLSVALPGNDTFFIERNGAVDVPFDIIVPPGTPQGAQPFALRIDDRADNEFVGRVVVHPPTATGGPQPVVLPWVSSKPGFLDAAVESSGSFQMRIVNPDAVPVRLYNAIGAPPGWEVASLSPDVTVPADNGTMDVTYSYRATSAAETGDIKVSLVRSDTSASWGIASIEARGFVANGTSCPDYTPGCPFPELTCEQARACASPDADANVTIELEPAFAEVAVHASTRVLVHVRNAGDAPVTTRVSAIVGDCESGDPTIVVCDRAFAARATLDRSVVTVPARGSATLTMLVEGDFAADAFAFPVVTSAGAAANMTVRVTEGAAPPGAHARVRVDLDRANASWALGEVFHLNVTLTNEGEDAWEGELDLGVPFGVSVGSWGGTRVTIEPRAWKVVPLTLAAASNCRCPVEGEFRVQAASAANASESASATIPIHLWRDPDAPWIDVALEGPQRLDLKVGQSAVVRVVVTNSGNSTWRGPLEIQSDANLTVTTSAAPLELAPGASTTQLVTLTRASANGTGAMFVARDALAYVVLPPVDERAGFLPQVANVTLSTTQAAALGTATVGVVAGGVVLVRRKWPLLGLALYARIAPQRLLEHPARRRVRELVEDEPGITVNEAERRSGLTHGAFVHHLDKLERAGIVASVEDGQKRALYVTGSEARPPEPRARTDARIVDVVARLGPSRPADVARALGLSRQAVQYHLPRLVREGRLAVEGGRLTARP